MENEILLKKACEAASNKKAININVLDISGISPICDFFIICSGSSTIQVKAIADEIDEKMQEDGYCLYHKEGYSAGRWVLLDFGNIIVHVFHNEDRDFYNLERLWSDAKPVNIILE